MKRRVLVRVLCAVACAVALRLEYQLAPISGETHCPLFVWRPSDPLVATDFVALSRSGCYGSCPVYSVRVFADGRIEWNGENFVAVRGRKTASIPAAKARALIERFRTRAVWWLCGQYSPLVSDSSAANLEINIAGRVKKIFDYAGSSPPWLQELQLAVDEVADTHQFRHGDPLREFISNWELLPKAGLTPLMRAAAHHDVPATRALLAAGARVDEVDASGWTALMYAKSAEEFELLQNAGADIRHRSAKGDTVLMACAPSRTCSLQTIAESGDINAQNNDGVTLLMLLARLGRDPSGLQAAIEHGARTDLRDKRGNTALDYLEAARCNRSLVPGAEALRNARIQAGPQPCMPADSPDYTQPKAMLLVKRK